MASRWGFCRVTSRRHGGVVFLSEQQFFGVRKLPRKHLKKKTVSPSRPKNHRKPVGYLAEYWKFACCRETEASQHPRQGRQWLKPVTFFGFHLYQLTSVFRVICDIAIKRSTEPVWNAWIQTIFEKWSRWKNMKIACSPEAWAAKSVSWHPAGRVCMSNLAKG